MCEECLCQHHLTTAEHAAPAAVRRQLGAGQRLKVSPVREPQATLEVLLETLHTRQGLDKFSRLCVIIWNNVIILGSTVKPLKTRHQGNR